MHISLKICSSQLRLPAINLLRATATILFTADFYLNFYVRFKEIFHNLFQLVFMFEVLATVLQPRPIPFFSVHLKLMCFLFAFMILDFCTRVNSGG